MTLKLKKKSSLVGRYKKNPFRLISIGDFERNARNVLSVSLSEQHRLQCIPRVRVHEFQISKKYFHLHISIISEKRQL